MMLSDLPDEVLCCIFDHLDVADMRRAALVCQRWSKLVFSGRRMNRVLLRPKPDECSVLLNSKRNYRHIYLKFLDCTAPIFAEGMPEKILHKFESSISSLRIESDFKVTKAMLRKFLLEVPNLQELTMNITLPAEDTKTIESFPALAKLKYLELRNSESDMPLFRDALNLATNSPRLEQLHLRADGRAFSNVLEHFSPQLKVVDVDDVSEQMFLLNFPRLRELHLRYVTATTPQLRLDFFRRHSSIQELVIYPAIPSDLFHIITSHCRNITYLGLATSNLHRKGDFKNLEQLTKLRHLEIFYEYGVVSVDLFDGCGVIPSLEKISTHHIHDFDHWNLLTLKQVAPELKCLRFIKGFFKACMPNIIDMICEYNSHIDSVILEYCWSTDGYKFLERLPLLRDLQCYNMYIDDFSQVHLPTVRFLKFSCFDGLTDRMLFEIPKAFPKLERLVIERCPINEEMVASLHDMIPSCKIDLYGTSWPVKDNNITVQQFLSEVQLAEIPPELIAMVGAWF